MSEKTEAANEYTFVDARASASANLKNPSPVAGLIEPQLIVWARRVKKIAYGPNMLESFQVAGYGNLPLTEESSPIVAVAHKKIQDIFMLEEYLAGRPVTRFHDLTLVAQAGLFSGVYAYRDVIPSFLKQSFLKIPGALICRITGRYLRNILADLHAHPVYREGSDIPYDEAGYETELGGKRVLGLPYAQYVKMAARSTLESVSRVQKLMDDKNWLFLILPEGKYCHDGSIAEAQDLTGFMAFRRRRQTVPVSIAYDELCPDHWGRIRAYAVTSAALPPPPDRNSLASFGQKLRDSLQEQTPVLASHLLALASLESLKEIRLEELRERFEELASRTLVSGLPFAPELKQAAIRLECFERFCRRKLQRWYRKKKETLVLMPEKLEEFARSERTVNDLLWNANNIRHAWQKLGFQALMG